MKVFKAADVVKGEVLPTNSGIRGVEVCGLLTELNEVSNPNPGFRWYVTIYVKEKSGNERPVRLTLPLLISGTPPDAPVFISDRLVYFRDRIFATERAVQTDAEKDEVILRVKRIIYAEQHELEELKSVVASFEAAAKAAKDGSRRDPISDDVKLLVWTRDGGACVRCGSKQDLQYDHIIPVAKGGGNSADNIQILCQRCNLAKGANLL